MLESEPCFSRLPEESKRGSRALEEAQRLPRPTKVGREAGPSRFIGVPGRSASGLPGWIGQFTLEEWGFGESHEV